MPNSIPASLIFLQLSLSQTLRRTLWVSNTTQVKNKFFFPSDMLSSLPKSRRQQRILMGVCRVTIPIWDSPRTWKTRRGEWLSQSDWITVTARNDASHYTLWSCLMHTDKHTFFFSVWISHNGHSPSFLDWPRRHSTFVQQNHLSVLRLASVPLYLHPCFSS